MDSYDKLRPYQQEDVDFLTQLSAAGIFNEQRTGKTPTALVAIERRNAKKILIVCPASALYQWRREFESWTGRPCIVCTGTPVQRQRAIWNWEDGLVISYDTLKLVNRGATKITGELSEIQAAQPDAIILDEAHRIRNRKTATAKAAFAMSNVPFRLALTGTPAPGTADNIWAILHFLYPNTFKSYWKFINDWFISKQVMTDGRTYVDILGPTEKGRVQIQAILARISTNRKRKDVMTWLPEKDICPVLLPLTPQQERYLKELEKYFETEHVVVKGVLDRLIRYRQICLDPDLLGLKGTSPKTDWLQQYVQDYPDRPTLIFSKFTSYLHKLADVFPNAGVIIGDTPVKKRHEICQQFQAGQLNLLLLNIDAAKEALTLDRAEAVIFTDMYPPIGDIMQAEDRFVATTQERADKPHLIYRLVMQQSYEVDIQQMIAARFSDTEIINNFKHYVERSKANANSRKSS